MIKRLSIFIVLLSVCNVSICQAQLNQFKITSSNTSFPDTGRIYGHLYNDILYKAADHYWDSSVIIITPKNFIAKRKVDMIFWFHGWNNNIDTALLSYGLSRQFGESGINAVLVLAETARDAPDSYGGKLEQKNIFNKLVGNVLDKLVHMDVISTTDCIGNIILAGHSGAYRVIANILQNGNVPIQEVILFDALYADTDKFLTWLTAASDHRFIDLYTNNGGTFDETKDLVHQLKNLNIPADSLEETGLTSAVLQNNKIIFIHTLHEHNDIIQHPDNFKLFIENSPFLKKLK